MLLLADKDGFFVVSTFLSHHFANFFKNRCSIGIKMSFFLSGKRILYKVDKGRVVANLV
tara:strand:+ start:329 stop:505 length:177 start_codon:yes stop_codon:yes gene_type:complete